MIWLILVYNEAFILSCIFPNEHHVLIDQFHQQLITIIKPIYLYFSILHQYSTILFYNQSLNVLKDELDAELPFYLV